MSEFTYQRKDITHTIPFNPTEEGWEYKHCNCQSAKFEKKTQTGKISLSVFSEKKRIEYVVFEDRKGAVVHKGTHYIDEYPSNQDGFKQILSQYGI